MSFVLSVSNKATHKITASVPSDGADTYRNIEFSVTFQTIPLDKQEDMNPLDVIRDSVVSVDFGNLEVKATAEDGTQLTAREIALNNTYTFNAIVACYRDKIGVANLESKNANSSRGK